MRGKGDSAPEDSDGDLSQGAGPLAAAAAVIAPAVETSGGLGDTEAAPAATPAPLPPAVAPKPPPRLVFKAKDEQVPLEVPAVSTTPIAGTLVPSALRETPVQMPVPTQRTHTPQGSGRARLWQGSGRFPWYRLQARWFPEAAYEPGAQRVRCDSTAASAEAEPGAYGTLALSKWSCLSTAGGTPLLGYPAGRVVTPASPVRPPREEEAGHRCRVPTAVPRCPLTITLAGLSAAEKEGLPWLHAELQGWLHGSDGVRAAAGVCNLPFGGP